MEWYWVDIAIVAIIAFSIVTGFIRGFVKELLAVGIWILALWLSYNYSSLLVPWLEKYIHDQTALKVTAFIIVLICIIIIGSIANSFLGFLLKRSGLSSTDRLMGVVFGFARGVFIVALVMVVVKMTSLPEEEYAKKSKLYAQFTPLVSWLYDKMPTVIKQAKILDKEQALADFPSDMELSQL